jgi:D-xylose transport system substrate-binding protein
MGLFLAVCCSGAASPSASTHAGSKPFKLSFSLTQITNTFSAMSALKPLTQRGKGSIAVILPNNASAGHFSEFDAPYMTAAFKEAGLRPSDYKVQLMPGSDQYSAAKKAISKGARVLIIDARYSDYGVRIEAYARAHGVPVIDYDWLTLGGSRPYYVGFDSLKIGVLLGEGLVNCVSAWHVTDPQVIVMSGDAASDYNAPLYSQGYDAILDREFASGWKDVSNPPGTWNPPTALAEFQQQYSADSNINAALIPNDEVGAPIIAYLQSKGIKPDTFPTTGLDATVPGLQNILSGYQCGTVYKPIWLEAQAAAALALYVRDRVTPPASLLNWSITDPQTDVSVPSVLLTPEWVTTENMKSTVIADKFVSGSQLCTSKYVSACTAAGIVP